MQTTKARARWLVGGNYPMWEVSHADTGVKTWADRPHDAAACLLKEFVLYGQVEKRAGLDAIRIPASAASATSSNCARRFGKSNLSGSTMRQVPTRPFVSCRPHSRAGD